jgi:hypothetical protein
MQQTCDMTSEAQIGEKKRTGTGRMSHLSCPQRLSDSSS